MQADELKSAMIGVSEQKNDIINLNTNDSDIARQLQKEELQQMEPERIYLNNPAMNTLPRIQETDSQMALRLQNEEIQGMDDIVSLRNNNNNNDNNIRMNSREFNMEFINQLNSELGLNLGNSNQLTERINKISGVIPVFVGSASSFCCLMIFGIIDLVGLIIVSIDEECSKQKIEKNLELITPYIFIIIGCSVSLGSMLIIFIISQSLTNKMRSVIKIVNKDERSDVNINDIKTILLPKNIKNLMNLVNYSTILINILCIFLFGWSIYGIIIYSFSNKICINSASLNMLISWCIIKLFVSLLRGFFWIVSNFFVQHWDSLIQSEL